MTGTQTPQHAPAGLGNEERAQRILLADDNAAVGSLLCLVWGRQVVDGGGARFLCVKSEERMNTIIEQEATWKGRRGSVPACKGAVSWAAAALGEEEEATNPEYNALDLRSLLDGNRHG
jgi:hypothetical protein